MTTSSPSALEELQTLRDFGRVMSRTDAPSFLLHWSDDGQVITHGDRFSLTMKKYRALANHFLAKAEALCNSPMFNIRPQIDLANLKDDMTNTHNGFSFVQHPQNGLKWKEGAGGTVSSDNDSDSSIGWDEPDMIPSNAPTDGSRLSWSRLRWPS